MKKIFLAFITLLMSSFSWAQPHTQQIKDFETYVEKARVAWQVPGLAVAVVQNGKIISMKGYGERAIGTNEKVDTQTLFACASTTKAMTAVCMGILVDEGKVKWGDAVVQHLPEFQLYDPYVTRELKIRDLFTHNSGVGNTDFLWGIMNIPSDDILHKMKDVQPSYSLRSDFVYQNIFYLVAGKVIEKISGQKWEDFIQAHVFTPLKMNRTFALLKATPTTNTAKPHYLVNGTTIKVITPTNADEIAPAGSVNASIEDMSKWMICILDSSKYEGGRLLKPTTWNELFKPQVMVPVSQFYPTMALTKPNWTTYGLGWFQHDYKGEKINFHTGSLAGQVAIHAQLPDSKLGIYVFGNNDHAEIRHALVYKAFDLFALGGNRDWSSEFFTLYKNIQAKNEKVKKDFEAKRVLHTNFSKSLDEYAGIYKDKLYGEIEVNVINEKLEIVVNQFVRATLSHWHYDTFRGPYYKEWYGVANATFYLNTLGQIEKVNFEGMEFKKVPR